MATFEHRPQPSKVLRIGDLEKMFNRPKHTTPIEFSPYCHRTEPTFPVTPTKFCLSPISVPAITVTAPLENEAVIHGHDTNTDNFSTSAAPPSSAPASSAHFSSCSEPSSFSPSSASSSKTAQSTTTGPDQKHSPETASNSPSQGLAKVIDILSDLRKNPPRPLVENPVEQGTVLQSVVNSYLSFKADSVSDDIQPRYSLPDTDIDTDIDMERPTLPGLATNGLPLQPQDVAAETASPARGRAMKEALLQKLRPPPLEYSWDFWHDRQGRDKKPSWATVGANASRNDNANGNGNGDNSVDYESRLVKLETITDAKQFWSLFNNFELGALKLRDSVHLFHTGVKPVWEDPRNVKGGAWTFRVPKDKAAQFWKEVACMAIGSQLQDAVDNSKKRFTFIDDICGISYSVRFNSHLISVWNRDCENTEGIERLKQVVLDNISPELAQSLRENQYYYKKHSDHTGFRPPTAAEEK